MKPFTSSSPRIAAIVCAAVLAAAAAAEGPQRVLHLPVSEGNPRNSEGDFIQLRDGRVLFVYTHFRGSASDHADAFLAGRYSSDGGQTWTPDDAVILPNEGGMNVMSVSLLRLENGEIAMFYLRKNSLEDCRAYVRFSSDEAQTWSEPILCIEPLGYWVVNNDRIIQLESGRLVMPAARHSLPGDAFNPRGWAVCFLSDDNGRTWQHSETILEGPDDNTGLQEPGVVELADGRIMMLCRTGQGSQFRSYSADGGVTWSPVVPTDILSPRSPASFEPIPGTTDLLMVWNDYRQRPEAERGSQERRPLTAAISTDQGLSWIKAKNLANDPDGRYCYTAIEFVGGHVLLAYMDVPESEVLRAPIAWLYE